MDVDKYMTKKIVRNNNMQDSIKQLIDDGLCVSKSQAKRVYMQTKEILNKEGK